MPSEREFLERRLDIVEERLGQVREYDVDSQGRFYLRYQHAPTIEYSLIREARLLEKLLTQVDEGKISKALGDWRKALGENCVCIVSFIFQCKRNTIDGLACPFLHG